ncbi:MAG: transporter substrate-binding domain-containing protein [Pseudomonadota bacterium]
MMRVCILAALLTYGAALGALAQDVVVGVRSDARPFVFHDGEKFAGFLFELCEAAINNAGLTPKWEPIDAGERLSGIAINGNLDMLCDPFTVTIERAGNMLLSQILFISGGGYISAPKRIDALGIIAHDLNKKRRAAGQPVLDYQNRPVGSNGPTAARQLRVVSCDKLSDAHITTVRIGILKGSTATHIVDNAMALPENDSEEIRRKPYETVCYEEFDTHGDGMARFCDPSQDDADPYPLSYYFGDRDILVALLLDQKGCDHAQLGPSLFSLEPYAIAFSKRLDTETIVGIQRGFLRALTEEVSYKDSSGQTQIAPRVIALFISYFEGKVMSPSLRSLYSTLLATERK